MQPGPIAIAWVVTAALLFAEHMALWDQPWRLDAPWNYLLGVLTLAVGWAIWGLTARGPISPIDAVANIGAVTTSGAVILACYWWRGRWEKRQKQSTAVEKARQLTQSLIDEGGATHARKPDVRDPSRRN